MAMATASLASPELRELVARGFHHQSTGLAELDRRLAEGPITVYLGVDLTAPSLHVGNLLGIMALRLLQRHGHRPLVVLGGATTRIGDPSGRDESRQILDLDAIESNRSSIAASLERLLDFGDGPTGALLLDNIDWLGDVRYLDFLRDVGQHFTINRMLAMESVRARLERESSMSFLEFNYMVLQAFDFVELHRRHGCELQVGGSDQWGNIVTGIDLARRMDDVELHGLTYPLLTDAAGRKIGKSTGGATWLSSQLMEPYAFWQWWRNRDDPQVGPLLRFFTELSLSEIERLESLEGSALNEAKIVLATEVTALVHGPEAAARSAETAHQAFELGRTDVGLPEVKIDRGALEAGIPAFALLRDAGLASSGGEARRLIAGGGAYVGDRRIADPMETIGLDQAGSDGAIHLRAGKKHHVLVRPS